MMWFSTSGRTMVSPYTLGVLLWACATLAWPPGEKSALYKLSKISQRHDERQQDYVKPHYLEGTCVDHDAGCPVFADFGTCNDPDISKLCIKSCTNCIPLCIDTGYGCPIIKVANLCNIKYTPICKKTCGACTDVTTSSSATTRVTTPMITVTTAMHTTAAATTTPMHTTAAATTTPMHTTAAATTTPMLTECNQPPAMSVNTCDFSTFPKSHSTKLAQNHACAITKTVVSTVEKAEILRVHNQLRAKVAKGQENRGSPGGQPPGSNIRELTWSNELAIVASAWAKQCPHLQHDHYENRRTCNHNIVGQNIYYTWTNNSESVWERGITRWYDEVKDVPNNIVPIFRDHTALIGHYTQLVWGETTEIGCGAVSYETIFRDINFMHAKIYVCNYATGGNIIDNPIYKEGSAATNCGDGFVPSSCNSGLCSKMEGTKSLRVYYHFEDMMYSVDLADPTSQAFKDLKEMLEDQFSSEYRRLLGLGFVDFIVKEISEGSLIIECCLIVKEDTTMLKINEETKNLMIPGGLDVSVLDIFKHPSHLDCKFTASVPAISEDYSRFGEYHTANLVKNCSCEVHKIGVTVAEREEILTMHNNYRSLVAQGKELRGKPAPQPAGANIRELVWNDQLAEVAQAWANQCPFLRHDIYDNRKTNQYGVVGQNIYYTWSNNPESMWTRGIRRWYDEVTKMPKIIVASFAIPTDIIGHYTQMLWAETTEIGCGAVSYRTIFREIEFNHAKIYVCNYGPGGNILGDPIYLQGPAATKCNGDVSMTYTHLCAAMPATTGTSVTSGPVVTSGTCKFMAATDEYTGGCDYAMMYNSIYHTAHQLPNCNCEVHLSGMDEMQKSQILGIHNELRALVARGGERRGSPGPQPPGANINQLTWSDQLAELAQAWANQCPFLQHDLYENRATCDFPVVGQNIYYSWSNSSESIWERGINRWYDEVEDLNHFRVDVYEADDNVIIGHYTQMVWAETSHIGCGQVHYKTHFRDLDFMEAKIYVCNYGTGGNILGKPIYKRGEAATQCDDDASTTYPDLCEMEVSTPVDSKAVPLWYVFTGMTFQHAYSDTSSQEFRDLKFQKEQEFTEGYTSTLGDRFVSFMIVAFHQGAGGKLITEAILTVKKTVTNSDIEAATLAPTISDGLDTSDISAIFVRPTIISVVTTENPTSCEFKAPVPEPEDGCDYSTMFSSDHSVNLPINCACAVHKVGITQDDKEEILRVHNNFRVKVARGEEIRGVDGAQPNGANIMELIWSDELANAAQAWANQCPFLRHDTYPNRKTCTFDVVGQNIYYTWSNNSESVWVRGINRWYDEVAKMSKYLVDYYAESEETIGHYTQIIWAETAQIGCGALHYSTMFREIYFTEAKIYVCNYGPGGNILRESIYKKGSPASDCIASMSVTYPELCESTLMKATVGPTMNPEDCDFNAPVPELNNGCDYSSYGDSHTGNLAKNCSCDVHMTGVTDEEKALILSTHNNYRAKVANGEEIRGNLGPQPTGSNIMELIWNDQLAEIAQRWANQCPFLHHDTYGNRMTCDFPVVGQNIYYTWTNSTHSLWERGIGRWYDEVAKVPHTLVDSYTDITDIIGHYTQVLWAETSEIGCGAVMYRTRFRDIDFTNARIYVCNYGTAGNIIDKSIYKRGSPASQCITMPSTNYRDLCESTRVVPTHEPTTLGPEVCKFTASVNDNQNACNYYDQQFPTYHTARLPKNCSCEVHTLGVSNSEREEILRVHNQYRSKVALGQEHQGNPGWQFEGSDIVELQWDDQLAYVAQAWANQCPFLVHDTYENRKTCSHMTVGQNIYYTWSNNSQQVWARGIERWYDEVRYVPNTLVYSFAALHDTIGHYTQMVWSRTTHIGCGAVVYKTNFYRNLKKYYFEHAKIYVCNYGPAGNIEDERIYTHGDAASNCPDPNKFSAYSGLCG